MGGYSVMSGNLEEHVSLDLSQVCEGRSNMTWHSESTAQTIQARSGATLTSIIEDDSAILVGGYGESEPLNDIHQVSQQRDGSFRWELLSAGGEEEGFPAPRSAHTMVFLPSEACGILFGGYGAAGSLGDVWELRLEGGVRWDKVALTGVVPAPRSGHSCIALDESRLLVFGGVGDDGAALDDLWIYDARVRRWEQCGSVVGPSARYNHKAVITEWEGSRIMGITGGFVPDDAGGHATAECFALEIENMV